MHGAAITRGAALLQAFPHIFMSDDRCVFLENRVATGVVFMVMGVDDKTYRLVGDPF